jgi:hypothetical protein
MSLKILGTRLGDGLVANDEQDFGVSRLGCLGEVERPGQRGASVYHDELLVHQRFASVDPGRDARPGEGRAGRMVGFRLASVEDDGDLDASFGGGEERVGDVLIRQGVGRNENLGLGVADLFDDDRAARAVG